MKTSFIFSLLFGLSLASSTLCQAQTAILKSTTPPDNIDYGPWPAPSLNTYLNKTVLEQLPNDVYISQFLVYILTGSFGGDIPIGNQIPDDITVAAMIDGGINSWLTLVGPEIPYEPELYNGK